LSATYKLGAPTWRIYPRTIQFDTMNTCNLDCAYCNVKEGGAYKQPRGEMTPETFHKTLERLHPYRRLVEWIAPFMNGEPLLDKRFTYWCNQLQKHPYRGVVDSNGTLPDKAWKLLHPFLHVIRISLSAHTPELYKEIHGADKFDDVLHTLTILKENVEPHQTLFINHMVCKQNEDNLDEFIKKFRNYTIQVFPLHSSPLQQNSINNLSTLNEPYRVIDGKVWQRMWANLRKPCQCWDMLGIGLNGELMHCVDYPAEYNYGNIHSTKIIDAWRQRNVQGPYHPLCLSCSLNRAQVSNKVGLKEAET